MRLSGSMYVSLRFLKRFYRDAYARLRAVLRPETVIVFHDGFRLLRWGGWFRRAGMRNVMLDTHQYLIAMEDPLFSGSARRLYLRSRRLPWLYRMLVGASGIAIRSAARRIPVLVGEWCVENQWGPTQPKPIGCIPPSVTIATRGMGRVGGADLLELPACALRETGVVAKGNRRGILATAAILRRGI